MKLGELLRQERERQGLNKNHLALAIPTSGTHIKKVEDGKLSPSFDYVCRACVALDITLTVSPDASITITPNTSK